MMNDNQLLHGLTDDLPVQQQLAAGPFSAVYENGALRYIRYGNNEILRMIYVALRDRNWGTPTTVIENETITTTTHSFHIRYTSRVEENNQAIFTWNVFISGDANGKIIFTAEGKAITDLMKNRAGFCILHPIQNTAGESLTITQEDGTETKTAFPTDIAPLLPLSHITKLQWQNDKHDYVLEMEGETFEMEDHRNWTDASFKTFCTPLSLPFPVVLKKNDKVRQQITFYPLFPHPVLPRPADDGVSVTVHPTQKKNMPLIGIGASTEIPVLNRPAIEAIKAIDPSFYTVEALSSIKNWKELLANEIRTAEELQLPLFISLELPADYKTFFEEFMTVISVKTGLVKYLLITAEDQPVTSQSIIDWAETTIRDKFPGVLTGIGSAANFAEINRNRKKIRNTDFISYAIHPQEHAFDNLSLIENAAAQSDTVKSARKIYPDAAIFITPVTLRRRLNPYAHHRSASRWTNEEKTDPRQCSLWNAGWTLASIKYLAEAGTSGSTYFQTAGKQGCCSENGELYPIGSLLRFISSLKNAKTIATTVTDPLACTSLLLDDSGKQHLLLANHTSKKINVKLPFFFTDLQAISLFPSSLQPLPIKSNQAQVILDPFCVWVLGR